MPLILPPRPPQPSPSLVNDSANDNSNGNSNGNSQVTNAPESSSMSRKRALDDAAEPAPEAKRRKVYEKRTPKSRAPSSAPETQTATAAPVSKTATPIHETQVPPPVAPSVKPPTKKKNKLDLLGYTEEELAAAQQMLFEQSKEIHALQPQPLPTNHETTNNPPSLPSKARKLDESTGPSNQKRQRMSDDPSVSSNNALGGSDGHKSLNVPQPPAAGPPTTFTPAAAKKSPAKARKSPVKNRKSPVKKATQQDIHPLNRYPSVLQPSQVGHQIASPVNRYIPAVQHNQMGQQTASPVNQYLPAVQHGQMGQQNFTSSNYTISPSQHLQGHNTAGIYTTNCYTNSPYTSTPYGYNPAQQQQQQTRVDPYAISNSNAQFNYSQTQPTQQLNGNTAGSDTMADYYNRASQHHQIAGNGPSLRPDVTPMHQNKPQNQQSAGQNLPPKFGMADVLPTYSDYWRELQRLQHNIANNTFPKSNVAAPNAGNNPQPDFTARPAPPASPHYPQRSMGSNDLPTKSGMTPMPPPRAQGVGQNSGHNSPAKSGMKPLLPPKPQDVAQKAGTNPPLKSCMKPLLPTKPQKAPQRAGTNPPLKTGMKPLLPPKPQDVPQKAGTNPPLKSCMKPLLPPKPQNVPQKAGTNPPLKTGMKPLLPPKAQPTVQKAGSTPPPKKSMTPTLPGAAKGSQSSTYYPAQAPQHKDASADRTYYPPRPPANTNRSTSGTRPTSTPQPPTPSPSLTTAHHNALGINYANTPRMGPNMQQVLGQLPNTPVASSSYNTPAIAHPPPKKVVPYTTAHAERASYRGGALMYEVPPSSLMARGYGGSAASGSAGSLRPLEFVAQDPPPGYGPTATTGYVHEHKTAQPAQAQADQQQQQQTASVVKPVVQRDAFPYFFETFMAEGSVASVASDRS